MCHFCRKKFPEREFNAHTVRCDEREVTCGNSWCRKIVRQGDLVRHMEECGQKQTAMCPKCGVEVLLFAMPKHREECQPKECKDCGERCITRIHKWCPKLLTNQKIVRGPFATEVLQAKYKNPLDFNTARIQLLWRFKKCKVLIEETIFRAVYKEMDLKKEGFAIFKAHDQLNDSNLVIPKRSRSVLQNPVVAPPSTTHYFPVLNSVPITISHVERLVEDIKKHTLLPYPAAWRVLTEALSVLDRLPNVVHIHPVDGARVVNGRVSQGSKLVVVGDLHGQVDDLLHILKESGMPSDSNYYIFNGDFVDRGPCGMEILLILFSLLLACPKYVSLNRGNHECDYMNEEYGFDVEVSTKYDRNMFRLIQRCFCALPLATVVGNSIFVVHGGLTRRQGVTISDIQRIQRFRQIPMPELTQPEEDEIFQDLLWSDPVEEIDGWRESMRGAGVEFGCKVTEEFLQNNKLDLVVRSHEECTRGYMEHHNRKLITVFSASNYSGPESNHGSCCTFVGQDVDPTYHTYQLYESVDYEELMTMKDSFSTSYKSVGHASSSGTALTGPGGSPTGANVGLRQFLRRRVKTIALRELRELVYQRRHRLLVYFSKLDRTKKGSVWIIEWVDAMRNILNLDLPWFFLRPFLVSIEKNRITYGVFLRSIRNLFQTLWVDDWQRSVCERLVSLQRSAHRYPSVSEALNSPLVSYSDFCSVFRAIDYGMSDAVLFQLFQLFDEENKGTVHGPEVMRKVQKIGREPPSGLQWDVDAIDQLMKIFIQARIQLPLLFKEAPPKRLTKENFMLGMSLIGQGTRKQLTQPQRERLFEFLLECSSSHSTVDYETFIIVMYYFDQRVNAQNITKHQGLIGMSPLINNFSFSDVPRLMKKKENGEKK